MKSFFQINISCTRFLLFKKIHSRESAAIILGAATWTCKILMQGIPVWSTYAAESLQETRDIKLKLEQVWKAQTPQYSFLE
jgi:hypothetical protein